VKTATHTASYSDLDMNRHVNNVQYVVWAMDIVDLAVTEERQLRELEINFNTEVRPADQVELTLYANPTEEGTLFVEGKVEGKNSFIIRLQF
jgi:acyl-ACP thioesterase